MNIARVLSRRASVQPNGGALAYGDRLLYDYAALSDRVSRLSAGLAELTARGDRVAIAMANTPDYLVLLFAAWHRGLVVVPVNSALHPNEIEHCITDSGAVVCFTDSEHLAALAPLAERVVGLAAVIDVEGPIFDGLAQSPAAGAPASLSPEDSAWIFYTSGTTGRPKGATLTHRILMSMVAAHHCDFGTPQSDDRFIHHAPLSHASGLLAVSFIAGGALQVVPTKEQRDPNGILALMRHWGRASIFSAPTFLNRLTAAAAASPGSVSGVQSIFFGGAPMYVEDLKRALKEFGPRLEQIYGQGESPMTITGVPKSAYADTARSSYEHLLTSVGWPRTGVEVAILGSGGEPVAMGETGEVAVRGDVVMTSYWNMAAATAQTLVGGWLHTGDLGCFDQSGLLTLIDRSKELIISGGTNIYPREVEEVLLRHPMVAEVSVIGIPDPEWGESVLAVVVARDGVQPEPSELDRFCIDNIARFKRPKRYLFADTLPKSAYGKVLKTELKTQVQSSMLRTAAG